MKSLPLPGADETLARFLRLLEPLTDDKHYSQAVTATDDFRCLFAPKLQRLLEQRAVLSAPDSWLTDYRRNAYLHHNAPALSTNQTLKIAWKAPQNGLKRVAYFVHALIRVHQAYLFDACQTLPENTYSLCEQWKILSGAARRPLSRGDEYIFYTEPQEKKRHIVVVYRGRGWAIDVLDGRGGLATPAQIENTLYHLRNSKPEPPDLPFTAPSMCAYPQAQEIRAQLISRGENADIWQCIEQSLFVLSLDYTHLRTEEDALNHAAFSDGSLFWAYKPLNYYCNISDDRYFLYSENTWTDADVLAEILTLAQRFQGDYRFPRKNHLPEHLNMRALDWQIDKHEHKNQDGGTQKLIKEGLVVYQQCADTYCATLYDLFLTAQEQALLKQYDPDALIQILLQYAQQLTGGNIYSSREIIDMRHYYHGRKAYMQTVSSASTALVRAMQTFKSEREISALFQRYMQEYQQHKKHCQAGGCVHSHLFALQGVAREQTMEVPFFTEPGFLTFTQHYLSTFTLRSYEIAAYLVMMPPTADGIAVNYNIKRNHINMVLTHKRSKERDIEGFCHAIRAGMKQIARLMAESTWRL